MLNVYGLHFKYRDITALEDVAIDLDRGEILSIVGPNGAGKTTLLKCICRIVKPSMGSVLIDGRDTSGMNRLNLAKRIGYMPQNSQPRFPTTVFDTVLMGRRPYIVWKPSEKDLELVAGLLRSMNLEDIALRDFDRLSGGQKQKVLLARAFAQDTGYLLLDEPTSNLDLRHQMEVMETVRNQAEQKGLGVLMALHDLNLAARFSHRIVIIHRGRVLAQGPPVEVITAENILRVYGVEAKVTREDGHLHVQVLRRANEKPIKGGGV